MKMDNEKYERLVRENNERDQESRRKWAKFNLEMQALSIRLQMEHLINTYEMMYAIDRSRADPRLDNTASIRA
jgi:hypothetical protein